MNTLKTLIFASLIALTGLVSCSKDDDSISDENTIELNITGIDKEDSIVKGTIVTIQIDVDDAEGVDLLSLMQNGSLLTSFDSFPSDFEWNTSELEVGEYKLKFAAFYNGKEVGSKEFIIEIILPVTGTVTDYDGNVYETIQIGTQIWMAENLKTTHYRNGDAISLIDVSGDWDQSTLGGCCNYDNKPSYGEVYGKLYNFYAVEDSRNIAPEGWHVPTREEYKTLLNYLGGSSAAGGKMKEAGSEHWTSPNITGENTGTNESGFTALPGGSLTASGSFQAIGYMAYFWTIDGYDSGISGKRFGYARSLGLTSNNISDASNYSAYLAMSVRCVKD